MKRAPRFIVSGGGTGGHIYPAIAIANELKGRYPAAQFLFVGANDRMEMEKVPKAGYRIEGLWISGIQRKLSLKNLMFPLKLVSSMLRSRKLISSFRPDVAIGTGGFASGPLLKVATSRKIPSLVQEQNSHAGITNKWLARHVQKICVAYDGMERFFPSEKIVKTGNPVRQDLLDIASKREEALQLFNLTEEKKTVLVLGGSLGARRVNQLIEEKLPYFHEKQAQLIWQCGKLYVDDYKKYSQGEVRVHQFLDRMDLAYAAADIIISRAGAISVSELCIVGKPVIFIPSPNVAEDHQTKNAMAIAAKNACVMIKEDALEYRFDTEITTLLQDSKRQQELSENLKRLALPGATKHIADEIEKLLAGE